MNYANQGQEAGQQTAESERAISLAMTSLASQIGDLRTVARDLARRIAPLTPAGSPFDRADKAAAAIAMGSNTPKAVRSTHCEQLDTRVYELRELTEALQSIVRSIEI